VNGLHFLVFGLDLELEKQEQILTP